LIIPLIILAYGIIGFLDITPLIKESKSKELRIYISMFVIAFVISILLGLGIQLPSPSKPIEKVVEYMLNIFNLNTISK